MRLAVQISGPAKQDLAEIYDFIVKASNSYVADKIAAEIYYRFGAIADHSAVGHRRDDLTSDDVWFSGIHSCLVVYKLTAKTVSVIAVLHMARDAKEILAERI